MTAFTYTTSWDTIHGCADPSTAKAANHSTAHRTFAR
jgi:hypothetical protein